MPRPNRFNRQATANVSGITRLRPPADLTEAERAVFLQIVGTSAASQFIESDMPLLVAYASAIVQERRAVAALREEGDVIDGKLNPWHGVLREARKTISNCALRLRLSPQGRAQRAPKAPEGPMSYYDRMALEEVDEAN